MSTPGHLQHTKGKETFAMKLSGGRPLSLDNFVQNQFSLGARETHHGSNGTFAFQVFKNYFQLKGQTISFSGSGAQHQNGVDECSIQTVIVWEITMCLHATIHWLEVAEL